MPPIALRLRHIHRAFPLPDRTSLEAVAGVDVEVAAGRLVALVGPSGCGKTTLLRIAGGLDRPSAGTVERESNGRLGFCFQEPRLLPWRTVEKNVALPLEIAGVSGATRHAAALRALSRVGLDEAAELLPGELSGGMRMRAALARAVVTEPSLLLLDEPFGALDEVTRAELDEELDRLRRRVGAAALLITHSIAEAVFLADEVVVLTRRPARVVERFAVPFRERRAELRSATDFALLVARVHAALRLGMVGAEDELPATLPAIRWLQPATSPAAVDNGESPPPPPSGPERHD